MHLLCLIVMSKNSGNLGTMTKANVVYFQHIGSFSLTQSSNFFWKICHSLCQPLLPNKSLTSEKKFGNLMTTVLYCWPKLVQLTKYWRWVARIVNCETWVMWLSHLDSMFLSLRHLDSLSRKMRIKYWMEILNMQVSSNPN